MPCLESRQSLSVRTAVLSAALMAAVALAGCGDVSGKHRAVATPPASLHVAVSSSLASLATDQHVPWGGGLSITVSSDGAALESLAMGYVDVAVVWGLRPTLEEGLLAEAIASDGLAFVVNPINQTGPLRIDDLRTLFSGAVSDWGAFGQSAGAVVPVVREKGAGTRALLEQAVMGGDLLASGAPVAASDSAVLDYVASHPGAVGYVSASSLREGVRALTVEERRPEPQRVRKGDYPLMGGIWFAYRPGGDASALLERLTDPDGVLALSRWLGPAEWAPQYD